MINNPFRITGPDFWTNAQFAGEVPASCCEDAPSNATLCDKTDAYQDGCLSSTEGLVTKALTLVIVVIVIIVLFQLTCMILAWCSRGGKSYVALPGPCRGWDKQDAFS